MMHLKILFLIAVASTTAFAQSLATFSISSAGNSATPPTAQTLHWNVGETLIGNQGTTEILNMGLYQNLDLILALEDAKYGFDLVSVWPNPTTNVLRISSLGAEILQARLLDVHGRTVLDLGTVPEVLVSDLHSIAAGPYYLLVSNQAKQHQLVKIQKM